MHQILSDYPEARTDDEKEAKLDKQVIVTQMTGRQGGRVLPSSLSVDERREREDIWVASRGTGERWPSR